MNDSSIENAILAIEESFVGVRLGDGISLREADVIDDYGSESERAEARASDEKEDWRRIPDELIERYPDVLCFMDEAGLRFHLPAFMRFTLRRFETSESRSIDSAIFRLCNPDTIETLRVNLTHAQSAAVLQFLARCKEIEDHSSTTESEIDLAIRQWQGDEAAARELKEIAENRSRLAEEIGALSLDLGVDWFTRYRNGELDAKAENRVAHLLCKLGGDPGD